MSRQLRNAEGGEVLFPQGRTYLLVMKYQMISLRHMHTRNIIQTEHTHVHALVHKGLYGRYLSEEGG